MHIKRGRLFDIFRGNGWYVSFITESGHVLFGFRPTGWSFYAITPSGKPNYRRFYCGPFEVEFARATRQDEGV